jgi:hypothetical protein
MFLFSHLPIIKYKKNDLINVKIWIGLDDDDNDYHDGGSHGRDPDSDLDRGHDHDLDDNHDDDPGLDHGDGNDVFLLFYEFSKSMMKLLVQWIELEVLLIFVAFYHIPILPLLHFD